MANRKGALRIAIAQPSRPPPRQRRACSKILAPFAPRVHAHPMFRAILALSGCLLAGPAAGCDTALLLAVDVSGSISGAEYALQMQGMADALSDPSVIDALVTGQDRLALVHWSGKRNQRLSLDWQQITSPADVAALAETLRHIRRPLDHTDTAIGQALRFSLAQFARVPDCDRQVIDLSGDGAENAGGTLDAARLEVQASGVLLNAIAIDATGDTFDLTAYFRDRVIFPGGFVMTAHGLADYPRAIRAKLLRELIKTVS